MSETLISVENVSKKFCLSLKRSLWYGAKDLTRELSGRSGPKLSLRKNEFWAIKDLSFQVNRGEVLGIIGHNGAGKTTTLRLLNGLINPDAGQITMKGQVGALIELGAGFNPILTAKENIYVSAAILGIPKREIDRKLTDIIEFAGVTDFLNTPIQSYSSGMKIRLGFSVAINLRPDIMLIDEVLAVGDIAFRNKCLQAIREIRESGVAFVFVSHSLGQIQMLCDRVLYLNKGRTDYLGSPQKAIDTYALDSPGGITPYFHHMGTEEYMRVIDVKIFGESYTEKHNIYSGGPLNIRMTFEANRDLPSPWFNFQVRPLDQQIIIASINRPIDEPRPSFKKGIHVLDIHMPKTPLLQGRYSIGVVIHNGLDILQRHGRIEHLAILEISSNPGQLWQSGTYVELEAQWNTTQKSDNITKQYTPID